jgi:peptidoglycan-associated lipoprotein
MRRLWIVLAATAMLAACSSDDTGGASGAGGANAGGPGSGYGTTGVGSSPLGGPGGAGGAGSGSLAQGVPDRVLFDTDHSSLAPDARATLDAQASWLQQNPRIAVQVAGNADERGTEEYNLALGQRRANAARDYLVTKGVQGSRITTITYGKDRPVALGSTPDAWAQNRNAITSPR